MTTSGPGKEETGVKIKQAETSTWFLSVCSKKITNQIIINIIDSLCTGSGWRDLTATGSAGKELANS